jgi:hypothetical protein
MSVHVYLYGFCTNNAGLSHASGNNSRMACHASPACQHTVSSCYSNYVFRCSFWPHKNHLFTALFQFLRLFVGKNNFANRSSWRCRQALGYWRSLHAWINLLVQKRLYLVGLDPEHGFLFFNQPFINHINGRFNCGSCRPFGISGLQHVKLAAFNGELDILHVLKILFQFFGYIFQLPVSFWHYLLKLFNWHWCSYSGNNILPLSLEQKLAVKLLFAS